MSEIGIQIGSNIRIYRRKRGITMEELSPIIHKSRSTISKYERGELTIDIDTLYDIADALGIRVEQLLYIPPDRAAVSYSSRQTFFDGLSRFYAYVYDGRAKQLLRCVFDVLSETEDRRYKVMMFMNCNDLEVYQVCENSYYGYMEHYDAITNIQLINQDMPMERASAQILAPSLDAETRWGLFNGLSSRPMMPIAAKMLFSKKPLKEDDGLIERLKISKEDIQRLRLYNMLSVT